MAETVAFNIGNTEVQIIKGDMLSLKVDAIVNAANKYLQHGGGIAGQIVRKGGHIIQEESNKLAPIKTGEAVITTGGNLPATYVIHAVGPRMGEGNEYTKLYNAIINSLTIAEKKSLKSIALPAISTGIFGYPTENCAQAMKKAIYDFLRETKGLKKIIICLYEKEKYNIFLKTFDIK
ncbi:MAG: hypothetical protein B5M53_02740 [Candidatus Cloacimonas sp. 4484_209]|nr:MAG: hypothetical protein B5M53_02740 [Candidatus Cloacimonas sp. 4484_209]